MYNLVIQTKLYTKDYTVLCSCYQLRLPFNVVVLISDFDSVRLLRHILEGLEYTKLYEADSSKGRNPAVEPKTFFKILT